MSNTRDNGRNFFYKLSKTKRLFKNDIVNLLLWDIYSKHKYIRTFTIIKYFII